jgi:hypothetical protein
VASGRDPTDDESRADEEETMAPRPIEEPEQLPGREVHDQLGRKIGSIERLYAPGGEGDPMWVTVDTPLGLFRHRLVFVPLARLKEEDGDVHAPYSKQYIQRAPEIEPGDELAPEDDKVLRDYYGIDRGDEELRTNEESYASQVPDGDEPPRLVDTGEAGGQA